MTKDSKFLDAVHKKTSGDITKHSYLAEESERFFPRNATICDLGGGLGFDALYFIQKGHNVVLLDISTFALKRAINQVKALKLSKKLLTKQVDFGLGGLPIKDACCDVVFSRIGLNYFPMRETQKLFSEVRRILKTGGKAYLALKSPDDKEEMKFLNSAAVEMEPSVFIEGEQIRSRFTRKELEAMLNEVGISDFDTRAYQEGPDVKRDEFGVTKEKKLYLNLITFTKL